MAPFFGLGMLLLGPIPEIVSVESLLIGIGIAMLVLVICELGQKRLIEAGVPRDSPKRLDRPRIDRHSRGMVPTDRRDLYEEEFHLWESMCQRVNQGQPSSDDFEALKVLTAAYGKLLHDTVKLNRVADRQYAWLIDSQDRLKTTNEDLQKVSSADMLTGLYNRHRMDRILRDELALRNRASSPASLILIDIDHFKMINDTWGHSMGDEVLTYFAQLLKGRLRSTDSCARWGGDEFLVLLPNTAAKDGIRITEQIRKAVATADFPTRSFTVSLGVTEYQPEMTLEDWLSATDDCLYWAKRQGRNRIGHPDLIH